MNTPICDFVRAYAESRALRLHMPGHKGRGPLGVEMLDITEIDGADSLYEADGIIRESEDNVSGLFGCPTFYSTEGSSLCIRAMLYLTRIHEGRRGRPLIFAGRNAHKTFLSAVALLDFDVRWLRPTDQESYLSCLISAEELDRALAESAQKPAAVYLTSPDYLGNVAAIGGIARVCHRHGTLLLVDNAHGAYLRFLPESLHPIDLGADICCDSAHKTLPVITGGAYLHISPGVSSHLVPYAKNALALFGSTSPSYLILQSLDAVNPALADEYPKRLASFILQTEALKKRLAAHGYCLIGDEALKITICAKAYGYLGTELADLLLRENMVCEFADPDFLVLMLSPETGEEGLLRLEQALCAISRRTPLLKAPPAFCDVRRALSIREAALSPSEIVSVEESEGRILSVATVGCPPAVPIVVCGERIDGHAIDCFRYYGIRTCTVVKEG